MEKSRKLHPYHSQLREADKLEWEEIGRKWSRSLRAEKVRSKMGAEVRIVAVMAMLLVLWLILGNRPAFFLLALSVMAVSLIRTFADLHRRSAAIRIRQAMLDQGRFRVLEAVAEGVVRDRSGAYCAQVRRLGTQIGGPYPIPLMLSKQVRERVPGDFPVLLVQLEGEGELWAIPRL